MRAMLWRDFGLDILRSLTQHYAERLVVKVEDADDAMGEAGHSAEHEETPDDKAKESESKYACYHIS